MVRALGIVSIRNFHLLNESALDRPYIHRKEKGNLIVNSWEV